MMSKFIATVLVSILLFSCKSNRYNSYVSQATTTKSIPQGVLGVYSGTLPCDECDGIEFTIILSANKNYSVEEYHLGSKSNFTKQIGIFNWDVNSNMIKIIPSDKTKDTYAFKVAQNKLILTDPYGTPYQHEVANSFELLKNNSLIIEKYWTLIELNGQTVNAKQYAKVPFVMFKASNFRVNGNLGCNSFSGEFEESNPNKIRFSKMLTTLKYCVNMKIEEDYLKIFETTDNFQIHQDTLLLRNGRLPAHAKFILIIN
jgi:heat shock protein HslJ